MNSGQLIRSLEDFHTKNDQYGNFISSSKIFEHNPRLLFFSSYKISIDQSGPFWPIRFPIKHPTPSHLSRRSNEKSSKVYYKFLDANHRQTYDKQPAIYKYTESLKHPVIVYDMDKSARHQTIKQNENENIC